MQYQELINEDALLYLDQSDEEALEESAYTHPKEPIAYFVLRTKDTKYGVLMIKVDLSEPGILKHMVPLLLFGEHIDSLISNLGLVEAPRLTTLQRFPDT